tara:strand:- start:1 stop:204 length:204 start_codon:yes stop_codon:yes gene_type:complete
LLLSHSAERKVHERAKRGRLPDFFASSLILIQDLQIVVPRPYLIPQRITYTTGNLVNMGLIMHYIGC